MVGWRAGVASIAVNAPDMLDLLGRIEEAAIGGDAVEALLVCQQLGGDADSAELREWAKRELEGHPQEVRPPAYRRVRGQLFGRGAAPGQRVPAVPIPMDVLTEAERNEFANGVPIWDSISEIAKMSKQERVGWIPSRTASLLRRINASNESHVVFDEIYFGISGAAFAGVVTAVRSRLLSHVAQLRASISDKQLDPSAAEVADSGIATGPTVNIVGSHNEVTVGDGGDVSVGAVSNDGSSSEPKGKIWRWLKRILEAVTTIGTVVSVLWGGAGSPL